MIHSMSGGVISENGAYTFVKVKLDCADTPYWFICDFDVKEGDRVVAPFGRGDIPKNGEVLRVENNVSGQVAPVPVKRAKRIIAKL